MDELEEARQIAKKARNGSAKAKVQGLIIVRREVADIGAFDGKTDEELMEEATKRATALGLPPPETQH